MGDFSFAEAMIMTGQNGRHSLPEIDLTTHPKLKNNSFAFSSYCRFQISIIRS